MNAKEKLLMKETMQNFTVMSDKEKQFIAGYMLGVKSRIAFEENKKNKTQKQTA